MGPMAGLTATPVGTLGTVPAVMTAADPGFPSVEETVVLEIYDGPHYPEKPSWYTDERDAR